MQNKLIANIPISVTLFSVTLIVYILYSVSVLKSVPCEKDAKSNFLSIFVHTDCKHALLNLYAVYALSRVEKRIGSKQFGCLLFFLITFNVLLETIMHRYKDVKCSIGLSGILFGIAVWEMVTIEEITPSLIASIVSLVALPSVVGANISTSGHVIGSISGLVGGLLYNKLNF